MTIMFRSMRAQPMMWVCAPGTKMGCHHSRSQDTPLPKVCYIGSEPSVTFLSHQLTQLARQNSRVLYGFTVLRPTVLYRVGGGSWLQGGFSRRAYGAAGHGIGRRKRGYPRAKSARSRVWVVP